MYRSSFVLDDTDRGLDEDWVKEMRLVSNGLADEEYCHKLQEEAGDTARYLENHGVKFVHHDEPNVLLEFKTGQHFVSISKGIFHVSGARRALTLSIRSFPKAAARRSSGSCSMI